MLWWRKKKPSHERAMDWFKANMVPGQGIIVHTKQPVPYPEVTGYFIPTLYNWGETGTGAHLHPLAAVDPVAGRRLSGARRRALHLRHRPDHARPVRGAERRGRAPRPALRRACDWMLTQVDAASGQLKTPSTELWTDIASDLIHTYALPPLAQAGKLLGVKEYEDAARFVLAYYKQQAGLVPFNRLSHFHAYAMEALCEMGELDLARQGMADVAQRAARRRQHPGLPGRGVGVLHRHGAVRHRLVRAGRQGARRPRHRLPGEDPEPSRRLLRQLRQGRQVHRRAPRSAGA